MGDSPEEPDELAEVHDISEAPDWRDQYLDERIAEHDATDAEAASAPTPLTRFRHGSLGVTLGAAMSGLGNVLEPRKKEETAVVFEHDEPDQSNDAVELHLDRKDPSASVVIIRPHKRNEN